MRADLSARLGTIALLLTLLSCGNSSGGLWERLGLRDGPNIRGDEEAEHAEGISIELTSGRWITAEGQHTLSGVVTAPQGIASIMIVVRAACLHGEDEAHRVEDCPRGEPIRVALPGAGPSIVPFRERLTLPLDTTRLFITARDRQGNAATQVRDLRVDDPLDDDHLITTLAALERHFHTSTHELVGNYYIEDVVGLRDLQALAGVRTVHGSLHILNNPDLISLTGLERLDQVSDTLSIGGSPKLNGLAPLRSLTQVTHLNLFGPALFFDLSELSSLRRIHGVLSLTRTNLLRLNLPSRPLFKLQGLRLVRNTQLRELNLSAHLDLKLVELSHQPHINSLSALPLAPWMDSLTLHGLNAMTELGTIEIHSLSELNILECAHLTTLEGLEQVTKIDRVRLHRNTQLTDISALHQLHLVRELLSVQENPALPACDVQALSQQLTPRPAEVLIKDNDERELPCPDPPQPAQHDDVPRGELLGPA